MKRVCKAYPNAHTHTHTHIWIAYSLLLVCDATPSLLVFYVLSEQSSRSGGGFGGVVVRHPPKSNAKIKVTSLFEERGARPCRLGVSIQLHDLSNAPMFMSDRQIYYMH